MTKKFSLHASAATLTLGLLLSGTALAQSLPSSADAGRIQNDIKRETTPGQISVPMDVSTTPNVKAPAGAEKVKFKLEHVVVEGANKLPHDQVRDAYADKLNQTITLADVYGIANKITSQYRNQGYLLSRAVVPQQKIKGGTVHIQVVEGYVSGYNIQGDIPDGVRAQIDKYAKKLVSTGTVSSENLERYLLLMNDIPGVKVRSVLAPAKVVGGAELNLVAEQDHLQGFGSIDNQGNTYLGPERLTLGGAYNGVFNTAAQANGTILWAPNHDELRYYSAGVRNTFGSEGTRAGMNVSYTETDPTLPSALGGALEPEGKAMIVSFNVDHPFIRSRALNLTGGLVLDITQNETNYAPGLSAIETEDKQRILRANGQFSYLDNFAGYNQVNGSLSQGLEMFGSSEKGDSGLSRVEGDPGFTKLNMEASRLQNLGGPFTGLLGVNGQYSMDPLLSSEEFGFGGNQYGRGYDFSEITGDSGLAGKIELAYNGVVQKKYLNDYQIYTFYDLGKVWNRDPGAGQGSHESAASAGIGSRLTFTQSIRGDAFIAKPLTRDVASRGDEGDDWRFKFSLSSNF